VGEGDHPVLTTLPDDHGHADAIQVEPPGSSERQVVVEPAQDAAGQRLAERCRDIGGEASGERGHIDRRDKIPERRRHLLPGDARERLGLLLWVDLDLELAGDLGLGTTLGEQLGSTQPSGFTGSALLGRARAAGGRHRRTPHSTDPAVDPTHETQYRFGYWPDRAGYSPALGVGLTRRTPVGPK
jgi:hypothetical protein